MRSNLTLWFLISTLGACGPLLDPDVADVGADAAAVDADAAAADAEMPDAFVDPFPSCAEIRRDGEECDLILAAQPGGYSCIVPFVGGGGGVCYPDQCGIALGGEVELEPGYNCAILDVTLEGDDTPYSCSCFDVEVSGESPLSAVDTRQCGPTVCQQE